MEEDIKAQLNACNMADMIGTKTTISQCRLARRSCRECSNVAALASHQGSRMFVSPPVESYLSLPAAREVSPEFSCSLALQVSVHVLGGLMALGYEIGTIMKRSSTLHSDDSLTIKTDDIEGMDQAFTQVPPPPLHPPAQAASLPTVFASLPLLARTISCDFIDHDRPGNEGVGELSAHMNPQHSADTGPHL